ncbi:MAG: class I SAM-dependent methyltransferase [Gaiellaceae bacterium]
MESGNGRVSFARKIAQKALVLAEPYVYAERTDEAGEVNQPRGLHALGVRINQAIVEAGKTPPWTFTADECRDFWASRAIGGPDNDPLNKYAHKDPAINDFLHEFWQPDVTTDDTILELGPNAGGNLSRLRELGYRHLSGVDINQVALDTLRHEHPELAAETELIYGPFEQVLPTIEAGSYDTVFTMAVAIHIHPASHMVFREMARIARKHVCVLETEVANARYTFARNYKRVFERLGCTQIRAEHIDRHSRPEVERLYDGYVARLFRVPAG